MRICGFLLLALISLGSGAEALTKHERLAIDLLRELVEINTTQSVGDNTEAAEAMARHLLAAGFPPEDVQVLVPAPRKGNLVARYRSPAPRKAPVLFLAHLDVVEADPQDWSVKPFEFLELDGYFYGRGTLDDKDEAAIAVANFIKLRQEGFVPTRDIIIALTADEEGGPVNGVEHLLAEHRNLVDAAFVINEGGGGSIYDGRPVTNKVQAAEKVYQSYLLEVTNKGGHSSLPRRDNAIYQLAQALSRIADYDFPVEFNEVTRSYFSMTATTLPKQEARNIERLLKNPRDRRAASELSRVPGFNARLRTTCVATRLQAGHADNALPQRAQATVNCRILPGVDPDSVREALIDVISDDGVAVTPVQPPNPSPASPLREDIMGPIRRATSAMWPEVTLVPVMSTGATDGLYFRRAGIPVYGVSGIMMDENDIRAHGRDERIRKSSFLEGLEFQERLMRAYAGD